MMEALTNLFATPQELIIQFNGIDHLHIYRDESSWNSLSKKLAQMNIKTIKFNFQFINKNLVSTLLKYFKKDDKSLFLNILCIEDDVFQIHNPFQTEKMTLSYHNGSAKMVSQFLKLN